MYVVFQAACPRTTRLRHQPPMQLPPSAGVSWERSFQHLGTGLVWGDLLISLGLWGAILYYSYKRVDSDFAEDREGDPERIQGLG